MADKSVDVVIIGSGPGGYVCAIRCAQLGLNTLIIEKDPYMGGTCLNVGCIPSKSLLHSTEIYKFIGEKGDIHGIKCTGLKIDVKALMKKKDDVVEKLRGGIKALMKGNKIEVIHGFGTLLGANEVEVNGQKISTKHIVLATGSVPIELPFMKFDGKTIVSSDEAIAFDSVPKKIAVVGAGAIGLELGSVWKRLGSEVTIVELLPRVAITFDQEISKMAERIFKKQGVNFELGAKVTGVEKKGKGAVLTAEKDGKKLEFPADKIIVCVGRRSFTDKLGLDKAGVAMDEKGRVSVDNHYRTNVPGIYAIGDIVGGPMLAHKAEEEGVALAELIVGKAGHVNYAVIPNVIYTDPEIASVGISQEEAQEKGIAIKTGKFPFAGNGRALASDAAEGFVKVIACANTDKLLGVQIIGHNASELIAAAVTHMEYGGSAEDMARTVAAHPTMSESLKEAAMAVEKRSIHGG